MLFGAYGMYSAVDWLYSKVPVRFPDIRICLSEGGIGWVAGIIDRLDHCYQYQLGYLPTWRDVELTPSEVMRRNFWFCSIDDPTTMQVRDRIGVDHIMVESDYPHADSSWPDTQALLAERFAGLPAADVAKLTHENAAALMTVLTQRVDGMRRAREIFAAPAFARYAGTPSCRTRSPGANGSTRGCSSSTRTPARARRCCPGWPASPTRWMPTRR